MALQEREQIEAGAVVEFFESKEVVCGVCTAVKGNRLTILSEQNREVSLAQSRVIHFAPGALSLDIGRDEMVRRLSAINGARAKLMEEVGVEELWSLLESEEEGYGVIELTEFVFSTPVTDDQTAAVQRVLLKDRLFFQFKDGKFYARSSEKVEQRRIEIEREAEREVRLEQGSNWLQAVWGRKSRPACDSRDSIVDSLKSYALFGQESSESGFVKELFKRAGIPLQPQSAFRILVRIGVWTENENLYLLEQGISPDFSEEISASAGSLAQSAFAASLQAADRRDLRDLHVFTVDSPLTTDYDDALSLSVLDEDLYEVGIHIADAAEFIPMGGNLDVEAEQRASSIYLPDGRISMLPPVLSEGACSLKAGLDRPALSFLIRMDAQGVVMSAEIVPSIVRVREQLTYEQVNEEIKQRSYLDILYSLALKLRKKRIEKGAISLPIPEIQVYVNPAGMIQISRYEKETPSQITVSEWMIFANGLAASYLAERDIPAIFRSQGECKQETDFTHSEHELFRIYRRRRLFARAELETRPKVHCSLAMDHYTTVTSPIRRYSDLVVQRQLKRAVSSQTPLYSDEELRQVIVKLAAAQARIFYIQRRWTRYWILKYMEQEDIHSLDALILEKNERFAHLLLPDFFVETNAPVTENTRFQPGEMVRVKIEKLNPREDILRVQLPEAGK